MLCAAPPRACLLTTHISPPSAGTRLLVHAGCGIVVKMPLLVLLTQQLAMMLLSANPQGYCTTPLLTHPLTRRRLHRVWAVLDAVPTILPSEGESKDWGWGRAAALAAARSTTLAMTCTGRHKHVNCSGEAADPPTLPLRPVAWHSC